MSRRPRVLLLGLAAVTVGALASACGTQNITVPNTASAPGLHHGAELFNQRCSGCHSLSYAAARGSASNPRIAQSNSGPNFNVRCERPVTRVLYAIENGGFSGAYMPQNIVVGRDAIDVAKFVSTYAGRLAPTLTGIQRCQTRSIGTLPVASASATSASSSTTAAAAVAPANGSIATNGIGTVTGSVHAQGKGKTAGAQHKHAHA